MSMMVAKTFGATAITITGAVLCVLPCPPLDAPPSPPRAPVADINGDRLDVAETLGATGTVNVKGLSPQLASEAIRKTQGMPADVTIDACGFNTAFQAGLLSTAPGGTMCMVGLGQDMVSLPLAEATVREVTLVGVFRYRHTYGLASLRALQYHSPARSNHQVVFPLCFPRTQLPHMHQAHCRRSGGCKAPHHPPLHGCTRRDCQRSELPTHPTTLPMCLLMMTSNESQ